MKLTLILAVATTMVAGAALAAEPVHSPRGAEVAAASRTACGLAERQALTFSSGKASEVITRKPSKGATERNLVQEQRAQVYTGKNAPERRSFEIAPAK
jgi:hypothetical protein